MTIQFSTTSSRPTNQEDNFPIGQEIILFFSESVDLKKIKESVTLFGADFDRTSGPDNALWINESSGENPFFLRSPGFKGFVDYDVSLFFGSPLKDVLNIEDDQSQTDIEEDRISFAVLTPKNVLKEESQYQLFVIGKNIDTLEDLSESFRAVTKDRALSPRTIFDAYKEDAQNVITEQTDRLRTYGSYEPKNNEASSIAYLKVIEAGEGSAAKYKWWFSDEDEPQPADSIYNQRVFRCVSRWRKLDRGVLVRFSGGEFVQDEVFKIKCYDRSSDLLETSYSILFQTSTDSVYTYPEAQSTSPIGIDDLFIPEGIPGISTTEPLEIISVTPGNGSVNNALDLDKIIIEFNRNIDAATVTQETVTILSYPVSGTFDGNAGTRSDRERKVYKIISVEDNKITLEL